MNSRSNIVVARTTVIPINATVRPATAAVMALAEESWIPAFAGMTAWAISTMPLALASACARLPVGTISDVDRPPLMFTGIVAALGTIRAITPIGQGRDMRLVIGVAPAFADNPVQGEVALGASIACSGCCLTALDLQPDSFAADASAETLTMTTLGTWRVGCYVNLERSLRFGDELGGHLVSGHVDGVRNSPVGGAGKRFDTLAIADRSGQIHRRQGSIAVDGVSLTVNDVAADTFGVNIIPHTAMVTRFYSSLSPGDPGEPRNRHAGPLRRAPGGVSLMSN